MKQTYLIGIVIALSVLIVLGLSKLFPDFSASSGEVVQNEAEEAVTIEPPQVEEVLSTTSATTMQTTEPSTQPSQVTLVTNKGDIVIELAVDTMPITTGNFVSLASSDFYDGIQFHRVIDGFMIQGGDPLTKDPSKKAAWGTGGPGYSIQDEFDPKLSNARGTLAMANAGPNTGGSQFFINTVDNRSLDGRHPVFGTVVTGMDVVDAISKVQTGERDIPVDPVVIRDVIVQ